MIAVADALQRAGGRIRTRPWLLGVGLCSVVLSLGALYVADEVVAVADTGSLESLVLFVLATMTVAVLVRGIATAALVPLAYGAVGTPRRESRGAAPTSDLSRRIPRSVGGGILTHVAGLVVGALAFLALLAVYVPVATLFQAVGYSYGLETATLTRWLLLGSAGVLFAAAAVAVGVLSAAGPLIDRDRIGFEVALRRSVRAAAADPRRALAHGFVVVGLLVVPYLVVIPVFALLGAPGSEAGVLALVVGVGTFTYTLAPVYRAAVAEHAGAPAGAAAAGTARPAPETPVRHRRPRSGWGSVDRGRLVLVGLVVAGLLVGSLAVRVADVRPGAGAPTEAIDPGASAHQALETGVAATGGSSYTMVTRNYRVHPSNDTRRLELQWVYRIDRGDRQMELYGISREDDEPAPYSVLGAYVAEGTIASVAWHPADSVDGAVAGVRTNESSWFSTSASVRERIEAFEADGRVPVVQLDIANAPADAWRVADRTDDRLVVETRPGSFEAVTEYPDDVVDGSAAVVLDPATGRIQRIEYRITIDDSRDDEPETRSSVVEFSDYDNTDVTRPPALGSRGLMEYLADVVIY